MTGMQQAQAGPAVLPDPDGVAPHGVELRHLRYFVAVADAGTFTHAAERMFITQPTLSQQIRRLEELVGNRLIQRRRDGIRLTTAGAVLLEESQALLSLFDHGVSRTRHAAGLGQPRLRVTLAPHLPDVLAMETALRLLSAAAAGVGVGGGAAGRRILPDPPAPGRRRPGLADVGLRRLAVVPGRHEPGGVRTRGVDPIHLSESARRGHQCR